ncbi:MAG: flavodoxin domain-containing protein, partial [Luteolibacter sp.]
MFKFPDHAPFSKEQRQSLESLLSSFDASQRSWLSSILAGLNPAVGVASSLPVSAGKLTVLYGTESGNSEGLAARAVKDAKKRGFQAVMKNMSEIEPASLASVGNLLVIVSTWGDGEPPESAVGFYKALMNEEIALSGLKFSVCALGDTSYEKFCQTGKDVDARLEALGGKRVADRRDCDVDYEDAFSEWLGLALTALAPAGAVVQAAGAEVVSSGVEYGKKNPFPSPLNERVLLNGEGSSKETIHLEFSLEGSGMSYEPGDALAVVPVNSPDVVVAVLAAAKLKGDEEIETKVSGRKLLADALREDFDITALSRNVLTKLAEATGSDALKALLADDAKEKLKEYTYGREIVDAIANFAPKGLSADALAGLFRKLPPRLYS